MNKQYWQHGDMVYHFDGSKLWCHGVNHGLWLDSVGTIDMIKASEDCKPIDEQESLRLTGEPFNTRWFDENKVQPIIDYANPVEEDHGEFN